MCRLLAGLLIALCLAAGVAGSASSAATPGNSQLIENWNGTAWTITASQNPSGGNYLTAATAVYANDVWAVGSFVKSKNTTLTWHPLAEHYNGVSWSPVILPTPRPHAQSDLLGVSASSATDVWAVGTIAHAANDPVHDTLIEHFNGTSWKVVLSLQNTTDSTTLSAVAAVSAKNAWAVGSQPVPIAADRQPLIEHWKGSAWRPVTIPNPSGSFDELLAISALSAGNIWAVGDNTVNGHSHTLVLHWNGRRWRHVTSPSPAGTDSTLRGVVAIGKGNVWAVGSFVGASGWRALIEHWDGHGWHRVAAPSPSSYDVLNAVSAVSSGDVWAVGVDGSPSKTLAEHWDGKSWTVATTPPPLGVDSFAGVAAVAAGAVWAVGDSNAP